MKLYATIAVHVRAADILRAPGWFERIRRAFGGQPDLRTGELRSAIEATALVEAARDALRKVGATNAISLVIDETVLFHDRDGAPDDLGDLFLAFAEHESVFGEGFDELRLAVEHREAGIHHVIEIQARPVHPRGKPAIRIVVSGRVEALAPRPGEDAEAYRKRAEPIASDARALEAHRLQFEAYVARLRDAVAAAMPTARADLERAEARIVRPDPERRDSERPLSPGAPGYDPYVAYYPSPLGMAAEMFLWSALFSMAMPPHFTVVDHHNQPQGFADDKGIESGPTRQTPETSEATSDATGGDDSTAAGGDQRDPDTAELADDEPRGGGSWWDGLGGDGDSGGDGGGEFGSDFGSGDFSTD